jgi:hypothetical protein
MIALAGAVMRHLGAHMVVRRVSRKSASSLHWPAVALGAVSSIRYQDAVGALKLGAGAFAGAAVTIAIMNYQESPPDVPAVEPFQLASVSNETVVYRQDRPIAQAQIPPSDASEVHPYTEQVEASDDMEDDAPASSYKRSVQTVSFVNPDAPASIGTITAAARQSIKQALIKVGGFVTFAAKHSTDEEAAIAPRKKTGSIMDEVDDYLWEVYQRVPIKKDGSGDFTWKDPAAAKRMGLALQDYVISGMDPEFREQLYHAGKAMDAAGVSWSMLSAFRDDYRQRLASGFKASVGNSLHGGSRRTGGYGHGRAIDITGADDNMHEVWRWIDEHGGKYGLNRPMPGVDPAHIQQRGDAHRIAVALRETRSGSGSTEVAAKASTGKTRVAKASSR